MCNQPFKIKKILICCDQYPTKVDPVFPFVEQMVVAFAKKGITVTVVAPQSLTKHFLRKVPLHPRYRKIKEEKMASIEIFQPYNFTFGNKFVLLNKIFTGFSIWYALKKIRDIPDICYGHFWHCSILLYKYAKKRHIPLFVSSGEASVEKETRYTLSEMKDFFDYYSGVFFASSKNKMECEKLGFLIKQKNIVIPNAIDSNLFYLKDKKELRKKFGINQSAFIVVFVGAFIHRKGPDRVAEALKRIDNKNISAFFIGCEHDGIKYNFEYNQTLYKGTVEHDKLVDYLNMSDVFVLPTLAEGCCNSIIEAMACGLPIISSNLSFNDDILDDSCSIRINPESVQEIADAIKKISLDNELQKKLNQNALKKVASLTIDSRSTTILRFMEESVMRGSYARMD